MKTSDLQPKTPALPPYTLIRSARRTVQLSLDSEGRAVVRAPRRLPRAEIDRFVAAHADWLADKAAQQRERAARTRVLTGDEIAALRQAACETLPALVEAWAARMGLQPAGVRITDAARRWGSCSARGRLCFSCRVMLLPAELREYIVVHELAHLRQMNHSPAFYAEVARWLPDCRARIAALRAFERAHPVK